MKDLEIRSETIKCIEKKHKQNSPESGHQKKDYTKETLNKRNLTDMQKIFAHSEQMRK